MCSSYYPVLPIAWKECKDGFYGQNCSTACGNCANSAVCNKDNGTCPTGCQENWEKPLCDGKNEVLFQTFRKKIYNNEIENSIFICHYARKQRYVAC